MHSSALTVTDLRCENDHRPLGIDAPQPRLRWRLESDARGQGQTAYRVMAATTAELLAAGSPDLWDTGKIDSDAQEVLYGGPPLIAAQRVFWTVQIGDSLGQEAAPAEPSSFEMGLLAPGDWGGYWIGSGEEADSAMAPLLRRIFTLDRAVVSARAYVCGLGYHELSVNGQKASDHVLDPAFTRYDRRALYVTHDITPLLQPGENVFGVVLGNSFFNALHADAWKFEKAPWKASPRLLFDARITHDDSTVTRIASDREWKVGPGPITYNYVRTGESYDARRERTGWNRPGYRDTDWLPARPVEAPAGRVTAQRLPPCRVTATWPAAAVEKGGEGTRVFDMGRNLAGWARLTAQGTAGSAITLRYAELCDAQGKPDQRNINSLVTSARFQTDEYVLRGDRAGETYEPSFVYHGFRYVEVSAPAETAVRLEAREVHTDFAAAGRFRCSSELLNTIQELTLRSYVSNFVGIPTDCPHRGKKRLDG